MIPIYKKKENFMFNPEKSWELLTTICQHFSQSASYHPQRVLLLSTQKHQWYRLIEFLDVDSEMYKSLDLLSQQDLILYVNHQDTPDKNWSLLNFYVNQLEALPASTLLLKKAHQAHTSH